MDAFLVLGQLIGRDAVGFMYSASAWQRPQVWGMFQGNVVDFGYFAVWMPWTPWQSVQTAGFESPFLRSGRAGSSRIG